MQKEDDSKDFIYNPTQPIDTNFNTVDRFSNLCKLVLDPISDQRKVNLSFKIISKHNAFMDSLKTQNGRTANLKSYAHLKNCMCTEYNNLREVSGLTIASSNLN